MKKSVIITSVFLSCITAFSSCVVKEKKMEKVRTVTVTGTGEVFVQNDQAAISLSVVTKNNDVKIAASENASKMTKVLDSLYEAGIAKEDISTSNYRIFQDSKYVNGNTVYGQYNVSNNINILVKDITKAGEIIDVAVKAGANQFSSINYSISSTEEYEKQARILAVKNAQATANTLATSSGAVLGKVIEISENGGSSGPLNSNFVSAKRYDYEAASTPVQGGKSCVTVTVYDNYELE